MAKKASPEPEPEGWLAKYRVEDPENFEPVLDRTGTERRVLGHISDEEHVGRGPRNTAERLAQELAEDPGTAIEFDELTVVQGHLDTLVGAGLIEQRDDGTYALTELGFTELAN
jgi:hypothetical protein